MTLGGVSSKRQYVHESGHGSGREAIDHAIANAAHGRHGYVTRRRLLALGLSGDAIQYRVAIGRLHPRYPRVYAVGHVPPAPYANAMAAVLACGDGAVLSHGSALTLWGFWPRWSTPLEVTTPRHARPPGLPVHRSRTLTEADVTEQWGVPVTSAARTAFDNAERLSDMHRARVVSYLRREHYLWLPDLAELLDRRGPCRATTLLQPLVAHPDRAPTRSAFEEAYLSFVKRHRLPEPEVNAMVAGHEADVYYPEYKLVVECDGYSYHSDRNAFESDRDRDADRLAAGVVTVRVTWKRLHERSEREAARMREILARRARELEALRRAEL